MHSATGELVELAVTSAGAVHVGGVARCGSVAACPLCGPLIRERRAGLLDAMLADLLTAGYRLVFLTVTVQHKLSDELDASVSAITTAYSTAFSGRAASQYGYLGQVKAWDYTYSPRNGWHPHLHNLLVFAPGTTDAALAAHLTATSTRYRQSLNDLGRDCDTAGAGWHWSNVTDTAGASRYAAKIEGGWGAALEMTRTDLKGRNRTSDRSVGLTPWQLLHQAVEGDYHAALLWCEYEAATRGRKQMVISRAFRQLSTAAAALVADWDADTPAVAAAATDVVYVEFITASQWSRAIRTNTAYVLLERARDRGLSLTVPGTPVPCGTTSYG